MASKEEDIRKLLGLMGVRNEEASKTSYERIRKTMIDIIPEENREKGEEFLNEFFKDDPFSRQLTDAHVRAYESRFSHGEILDMVSFYESPTGRKFVETVPDITQVILKANKKLSSDIVTGVYRGLKEAGIIPRDEAVEAAKSSIMGDIMKRLSN